MSAARYGSLVLGALLLFRSAGNADGVFPRTLVFNVTVTNRTHEEERVSAIDIFSTSNTAHYSGGLLAHGTISVTVRGFTDDGALGLEVVENTDNHSAPKVQVNLTRDGLLRIAQADVENVTDEEQSLLRTLAQGFLTRADLDRGRWQRDTKNGNTAIHEEYHVVGSDEQGNVRVDFDQRVLVRDVQPFDVTSHNHVLYSFRYTVPRKLTVDGTMHQEEMQSVTTTFRQYGFELISDSLEP